MLDLASDQPPPDAHLVGVAGDLAPDLLSLDTRASNVGGNAWKDADTLVLILADALDDIERTRTANENRLRSLGQVKGIPADTLAYQRLDAIVDGLRGLEQQNIKALEKAVKAHPLGPWIRRTKGVGEKQGGRLLAAIGNPYIRPALFDQDGVLLEPERPRRGPAELWAYCGLAPGQRRQKGVKSNWNAQAKMRAYLVAKQQVITRGAYRGTYDAAKANWAGRDVSDGHKDAHALRVVAKEILKGIYNESRDLHASHS